MKSAALIGISNHARQHLLIVGEQMLQGRLRLSAATVVNQREEAFLCERLRQLGCEIFDHTDRMWERFHGRVDLCFIPTGIHLHAAMTLQALRAGANVLVEKPLAASVAQAREITACEKRMDRFVAVGFQDFYSRSTWAIKAQLLAGRLGELKSISFSGLWPRPADYYTRNDWAGRLRRNGQIVSDSPVSNAFAHFLNLALFWAGGALEESARAKRVACELYRTHSIESFDTCCARVELSTGCELRFHVTHSCQEDRIPRLVVTGTTGSLVWEQERYYEFVGADGSRERHELLGKIETKIAMADAVVARVNGEPAEICSTAIAMEHLRLVEVLHHAPIADMPARYVHRGEATSGQWTAVRGIEADIDEASRNGRLWSEMGIPWAVAPFVAAVREWDLPEVTPASVTKS